MFNRKSIAFGILASILAGCASQTMPNPMMARGFNVPGRIQTFNATTNKNLPFSAHFVNAYAPTIAQNEPAARQDPNGPGRTLLGLIQSARQTLDGAFYDIGDPEVVDALIAAKNRGVRVRLVTDNENLFEKVEVPLEGRPAPPRETIVRLKQNGIPVIDDNRSGLMHHKFLIVDGQAVWMGSTNVTKSSLYQHNNNAIVLRHPQVAANYAYEFERMFTQKIFGVAPRQLPFPVIQIGQTTIRTFFSPRGGAPEAIAETLQRAQKSVRFMAFSFTDKAIADIMIRKRNEGLNVEGVFDQCLGYGQYSAKHVLSQNKIYNRHDGNEALLHHKTILADNTVITGSFNFSANADKTNNENMLIIENAPELAQAYQQEYARVMQAAKVNNPPENKCPGDKPATPVNPAPVTEAQP